MRRLAFAIAALFLSVVTASAQYRASAPPDPFAFQSNLASYQPWLEMSGLTPRSQVINPAQKTLVLLVAGQSQATNITPTLYTPTNSSAIDQFNIYDGASYPIAARLLGTSFNGSAFVGAISPRIADLFVTNAVFDRVIIENFALSGTSIDRWGTGGDLSDRTTIAIRRLASRGITPATTGVTFAFLWMQGESDTNNGTTQAAYTTSWGQVYAALVAAGFSGRTFICKETWSGGVVSAAVQAAQVAAVNGATVFSGGDLDSLNATNRQADNTHFNDTGAAAAAALIYAAMHASGAPF